ncbi:hypothetical protein F4804DRAFT_196778 [Jackrogersella minutella]|nr:hypothetical protein F4804DRAFT_196778 [Jackrogersella minutella]
MGPPKDAATHNEIWDDSTLLESWNDAEREYKKYHSIHRKGGDVESLLKSNQSSDAKDEDEDEAARKPSSPHPLKTDSEMRGKAANGRQEDGTSNIQHSHPLGGTPGPPGLLGSVQDEGLKRLLMSWYYAGYYTGLYEGQQSERSQQGRTQQ